MRGARGLAVRLATPPQGTLLVNSGWIKLMAGGSTKGRSFVSVELGALLLEEEELELEEELEEDGGGALKLELELEAPPPPPPGAATLAGGLLVGVMAEEDGTGVAELELEAPLPPPPTAALLAGRLFVGCMAMAVKPVPRHRAIAEVAITDCVFILFTFVYCYDST